MNTLSSQTKRRNCFNYQISIPRKGAYSIGCVGFLLSAFWLLTHLFPGNVAYMCADILVAGLVSLFVIMSTAQFRMSYNVKCAIILGFVLRVFLALLVINSPAVASSLLGSWDNFYPQSIAYFNGNFSSYYTNYPYVLNAIFQFTGPGKFAPAMFNILAWFLGFFLLQKAAGDCRGREYRFFLLIYTFLPVQLIMSANLMRESIIALSLMLSFSLALDWMESGKLRFLTASAILAVPAIYLHKGNASMWIALFLIFVFWQPRQQRWRMINPKLLLLPLLLLLSIFLFEMYFGKGRFSSFRQMINGIAVYSGREARADYTSRGMLMYRSLPQFIGNMFRQMLYFWVSPTPRYWSSPVDLFGFCADAIPWLLLFFDYFKSLRNKSVDRRAYAGIFVWLIFTFIYGWGSRNGGTAMRHRGQLIGVMTMAALVAVKQPIFYEGSVDIECRGS